MKNFNDYMSLAINRQSLKSNNALARELNINNAAMSALFRGKSLPAESTMIKLAELAGLPKEEALIDLNLWRSEKQPEVKTVWLRLSKMITKCIMFAILTTGSSQVKTFKINDLNTYQESGQVYDVNIMRQIALKFLRALLRKIKSLILQKTLQVNF